MYNCIDHCQLFSHNGEAALAFHSPLKLSQTKKIRVSSNSRLGYYYIRRIRLLHWWGPIDGHLLKATMVKAPAVGNSLMTYLDKLFFLLHSSRQIYGYTPRRKDSLTAIKHNTAFGLILSSNCNNVVLMPKKKCYLLKPMSRKCMQCMHSYINTYCLI